MKENTNIQSIGQVDGIYEDASYAMRVGPDGRLWFIGGKKSTQIYRFDGSTAHKWDLNEDFGADVRTEVTFSGNNEVFFSVGRFKLDNPTVIKINEDSAEKWICEDLQNNMIIERMAYTPMGLVCVFGNGYGSEANDFRLWKSGQFIRLVDLSKQTEYITALNLTSNGHLLIFDASEYKGIVYDLANKKILNTFLTHRSYMKFITRGEYNINYCDTRIEIRDPMGHLIHDVDTFGESGHPISKIVRDIDSEAGVGYVNVENVTFIDYEHILIHFSDRQRGRRHYLRSIHIPTMSLDRHPLDGCIKSSQVISGFHFDKSGALWLNQYINKNDHSKLIVVREGTKKPEIVNKPEHLFK
ncbi:hypothetical protein [Flagellimonas sp.]|uniref:hypothetical protein n=1 Tax=Flagellimonas sp. TaxID=2058762 RepID=UPI003B50DA70